jgi:uncharacterized phage protein (TIGR02218 family)
VTLTDHISTGTTTLCYCWVIRRRDDTRIGFTDHDQDVVIDGVTCHASTGMTTTKYSKSLGLNEDDMEVEGVIDNDLLTEEDLLAGQYDDADADLYLVNWSDPTQFNHLATGQIGAVTERDGGAFTAVFLSLANLLGQNIGRVYSRSCETYFGSAECGIDATLAAYRGTATVTAVDATTITVSGLSGFDDGWFTYGVGEHSTSGLQFAIREHSGTEIRLWQRPRVTIEVGDEIVVTAGCRRDADTCQSKFSNILNFRGFPFVPGNDRLTQYPIAKGGTVSNTTGGK